MLLVKPLSDETPPGITDKKGSLCLNKTQYYTGHRMPHQQTLLVKGSTSIRDLSSNSMTTTLEQKIEKQNSSSNRTGKSTFQKCRFRPPKGLKRLQFSPLSFLKHLADKVARALHLMAMKRRPCHKQPVPGVPVASSKPIQVPAIDSHRTEAVEDCIKYINASA